MNKIASPQDLQAELGDLLAYAGSKTPSRARLASELRDLASRVAGREASADKEELVDSIGRGDRVTIVDRFGKEHTGKAVMKGPAGWVLNMGGSHGTPGIASEKNIVKVKKPGKTADGPRNMTAASGKAWSVPVLDWMREFEKELAEVISSSKGFEVTKDEGARSYEGRGLQRMLIGKTSDGIANAKIVVFWEASEGVVVVHVNYHAGQDLKALFGRTGEEVGFGEIGTSIVSKVKGFFNAV